MEQVRDTGHGADTEIATIRADVAIIGGGPVGMVLALELGRRGVSTVLVSERHGTSPHPQANATQARTMEHFRRLGLSQRIRELGLPPDYPTDIAYFTRYSAHELARFRLPSSRDAGALVRTLSGSWSAAELPHRCSQMFIEAALLEALRGQPTVRLMHGWRAVRVDEARLGVSAWVEPVTEAISTEGRPGDVNRGAPAAWCASTWASN